MKLAIVRTLRRAKHRMRQAWMFWRHERNADYVPLLIVAEARTGSTLLEDYLKCHSGVVVGGEVLNPFYATGLRRRMISKLAAIRHIRHSTFRPGAVISAAKLHLSHMAWHDIAAEDLVHAIPKARFIVLYRASIAEQFVSREIAKSTRRFEDRDGKGATHQSLRVDIYEFTEFAEKLNATYQQAAAEFHRSGRAVCVSYEELVSHPQAVFEERICPFLGLDPAPLHTTLKKQNQKRISEIVSNFDELETVAFERKLRLEVFEQASCTDKKITVPCQM